MRNLLLLLSFVMLSHPVSAGERLTVREAVSGDSFILSTGTIVRLTGIKSPNEPALAAAAKAELSKITATGPILLEEMATDRYGRMEALAAVGKNWVQGEMLRAGAVFVYPPLGDEPRLEEMLQLERAARKEKRGIWRDAAFADVVPDDVQNHEGRFVSVRGAVVDAVRVKNKYFLNFGEDWRRDFTIMITAGNARAFKKAKIDLLKLAGKQVRVRGMVQNYFGPMIEVTNPAQIEIIR